MRSNSFSLFIWSIYIGAIYLMKLANKVTESIKQAVEQARKTENAVLLSIITPIEEINFPKVLINLPQTEDAFYWQTPDDSLEFTGIKTAAVFNEKMMSATGVQQEWSQLLKDAVISDQDKANSGLPLLFGGFSFDDKAETTGTIWSVFGKQLFLLPELMFMRKEKLNTLTINCIVQADDTFMSIEKKLNNSYAQARTLNITSEKERTPLIIKKIEDLITPTNWDKMLNKGIEHIEAGVFTKVVLARQKEIVFNRSLHIGELMAALLLQQPNCYRYLLRYQGTSFLGASPERLLYKEGQSIYSAGVAGSIAAGKTEEQRQMYADELLADPKNLHEHEIVVSMITNKLAGLCHDLNYSSQPQILSNRDIQHLYTPIKAELNSGMSFLTLVKQMHPTPALGGFPSKKTVEWIAKEEPLIRGFFGAPIGWYDSNENGEFAVGIRSLAAQEKTARLFAGCGIVADSVPENEWHETAMKFQPMLRLLGGTDNDTASN